MDKLREPLKEVCRKMITCSHYNRLDDKTFDDYMGSIEKVFKAAGWQEPRRKLQDGDNCPKPKCKGTMRLTSRNHKGDGEDRRHNWYQCRVCHFTFVEEVDENAGYVQVQPAEGELVECPYLIGGVCTVIRTVPDKCIGDRCSLSVMREAQLAHMKAQGWVKLPSVDQLQEVIVNFCEGKEYEYIVNLSDYDLAQELLKLLKEAE